MFKFSSADHEERLAATRAAILVDDSWRQSVRDRFTRMIQTRASAHRLRIKTLEERLVDGVIEAETSRMSVAERKRGTKRALAEEREKLAACLSEEFGDEAEAEVALRMAGVHHQ